MHECCIPTLPLIKSDFSQRIRQSRFLLPTTPPGTELRLHQRVGVASFRHARSPSLRKKNLRVGRLCNLPQHQKDRQGRQYGGNQEQGNTGYRPASRLSETPRKALRHITLMPRHMMLPISYMYLGTLARGTVSGLLTTRAALSALVVHVHEPHCTCGDASTYRAALGTIGPSMLGALS